MNFINEKEEKISIIIFLFTRQMPSESCCKENPVSFRSLAYMPEEMVVRNILLRTPEEEEMFLKKVKLKSKTSKI